MAAKSRCKNCGHARGPRSTAPMTKGVMPNPPVPKKAPCGCECHGMSAERAAPGPVGCDGVEQTA